MTDIETRRLTIDEQHAMQRALRDGATIVHDAGAAADTIRTLREELERAMHCLEDIAASAPGVLFNLQDPRAAADRICNVLNP